MRTATVALGGNVGPVPQTFVRAIALLNGGHTQVTATSRLYRSQPLLLPLANLPESTSNPVPVVPPAYFNAACTLRTQLGPRQLLRHLQAIEIRLGRRRGQRWGPRTIDLDLLTYEQRQMHDASLTLPHPGIAYRAFVLNPLSDLGVLHPWPNLNIGVNDLLCDDHHLTSCILHSQLSWMVK